MVKAFISYSWDNDDHKNWVRELAAQLRSDGVDGILDQWELTPGDQLTEFMEKAVRESDYVLIVCTHNYKERSDSRKGGVGYEGDIMTAEVLINRDNRKFIPILREQTWSNSIPSWLSGKYGIDLSSTPYSQEQYADLKTTLLGIRPKAPPIGNKKENSFPEVSNANAESVKSSEFEPIQILGVIADKVGTPRNDGTRGSALYEIPFLLSQTPPYEWAELFVEIWRNPPRYSSMHRRKIASIVGKTIVLDGTTMEEVRDYHRDTLVLVVEETNKKYKEMVDLKKQADEEAQKQMLEHKKRIDDISGEIKF